MAKTTQKAHTTQHQIIKSRGLDTAWLQSGSKNHPVLILLHGFPDDASVWQKQIEYFSKSFLVIAPFLRGAGRSQKSDNIKRYGLFSGVFDLLEILNHINLKKNQKVYIVGHDIGSVYAWTLAELIKEKVAAMVIVNGIHPFKLKSLLLKDKIKQLFKSWYIFLFFIPYVPQTIFSLMGKNTLKFIYKSGGMPSTYRINTRSNKDLFHLVKHYRGILLDLINYAQTKSPLRIQVPVLSISSKQDPFLVPTYLHELESFTYNPTVRVVNGKHWLQVEQPDYFNKLVDEFFNKLKQ